MKTKPLFSILTAVGLLSAVMPLQMVATVFAALTAKPEPPEMLQFAAGGHALGFTEDGVYTATGSHALHMEFVGAKSVQPQSATSAEGQNQVSALGRVTYAVLWDGIDLTFDAYTGGIYTTTYTLAPGADPAAIRLRYNAPISLNEDGTLTIAFATGTMTETAPIAWQEINGVRVPVEATFQVNGDEVGFDLGAYDSEYALVIDPSLVWNTFIGGFGDDTARAITVDTAGNVYLAGSAADTWGTPVRVYAGGANDAFVAKLDSAGNLFWHTYLGGVGSDDAQGIGVDSSGNVYVAGSSAEAWGSPVRAYSGSTDAFVAKLDSGGALIWHTFLGGTGYDAGRALAMEGTAAVLVAGYSDVAWGTPARAFTGGQDAFAARLDLAAGSLTWSTFLGGSGSDIGNGISRDAAGGVYVTGDSGASWGTPVRAYTGGADAFAAKLVSATGALTWNTFLGGSGNEVGFSILAVTTGMNIYVVGQSDATWGSPVRAYTGDLDAFAAKLDSGGALVWNSFLGGTAEDTGHGVGVDISGNVFVGGSSLASWGSPIRGFGSSNDAFAAKLDSSGALVWNTFLGGDRIDIGTGLVFLWSGTVYVCGGSMGTWEYPVRSHASGMDGMVAVLNGATGALQWNTFVGGYGDDIGQGITVDAGGNVYLAGSSTSSWGVPQRQFSGDYDAFAAKIDPGGNPLWHTFLGGGGEDRAYGIIVNADGDVHVAGFSSQGWGSPIRAYTDKWDAFAVELDSSGNLVWLTFLGAEEYDDGEAIAEDISGNLYVTGFSGSTWGSPVRAFTAGNDAYVAKLDSDGGLVWNTFLGGADLDYGAGIAVTWNGDVYVNGGSQSSWGSPLRAHTSGYDGMVAKLSASTGGLAWNTFLGGTGEDMGVRIAADAFGKVYAVGYSGAAWGSPVRAYAGGVDAYAVKLDSSGVLYWNTFLGGGGNDFGAGIAGKKDGTVYVSGTSYGSWGDPLRAYSADSDGFVAKLNSMGGLDINTFLGGAGSDAGNSLVIDGDGFVYMTGTSSQLWEIPVHWFNDGNEAYAAKLYFEAPGALNKSAPADDAYVTTGPTLSWGESDGADSYEYCYDTSDNNTCDALWISTGTDNSVELIGLVANTTFYWQVRAVNAFGETEADDGTWWSFTTLPESFGDVPSTHWAWSWIERLFHAGITSGCGGGNYCPNNPATRAEMAIFLERGIHGSSYTPPAATGTVFGDVPITHWAADWIEQLYADGITSGCGGGNYCPNDPVTRAEMAIFLLRSKHGSSYTPPAATGTVFGDVPISHWAAAWIEQLYAEGITSGCGDGNYCPNDPVTRAEMAVFLVRTFDLP
jgi:hypothetical protein